MSNPVGIYLDAQEERARQLASDKRLFIQPEQALRTRALELAVRASSLSSTPESVVYRARAFEAYLKDGAVPEEPEPIIPKRTRSW